MRRALLAVALGGVLLATTACSSDDKSPAAAPAASTPSTAASIAGPDYPANTKLVCGKVEKVFDADLDIFGTQMGKMIAHKEAKQTAEADKAEKAAATGLKNIAAKVRKETAAAEDPELKTAGEASATKFAASAADTKFFDAIKTTKDLDKTIEGKMTDWLSPVAGYCA
jgi:peroxiredoxin family protein